MAPPICGASQTHRYGPRARSKRRGAGSRDWARPGSLPAKVKELIALAIAVSKQCDGCVAAHARGAVKQGATPQEAAEAIGVAILMSGGPGTVWGPRAYAAIQEYLAQDV